MSRLDVGPALRLDLAFLSLRKVVFGGSGAGKTTFGRVMFEEATKAGVLCGAVDLKGDWWGLKASADGREDGIPVVVFGGEHQDLPLDVDGGAQHADIVVDLRQPFIMDLEELSRARQMKFLAAFLERLYDRNRDPLVLFLDEADRYAPQKPMSPEANLSLGAMEDVAKRGRKHGVFPMFITQRNASLNKNVSELCDVSIVFRTSGPNDQEAVKDWFGTKATREQRDQVMTEIAGLADGTAVFCSAHPKMKLFTTTAVRRTGTFDSSATPEIGKRRIEPKRLAQPDLEAIRKRMTDTIERRKAEDPKELKRQIAELNRELTKARHFPKPAQVERAPKVVKVKMIDDATMKRLDSAREANLTLARRLEEVLGHARELQPPVVTMQKFDLPPEIVARPFKPSAPTRAPWDDNELRMDRGAELGKMDRALLTALAQHPKGLTKRQVLIFAGYSRSGNTATAFGNFVREGWIAGDKTLTITPAGIHALGYWEALPTGAALRDKLLSEAGPMEAAILKVLFDAYPNPISKTEVLERAGYKRSGNTATLFGQLATKGYARYTGGGIVASEELFQ